LRAPDFTDDGSRPRGVPVVGSRAWFTARSRSVSTGHARSVMDRTPGVKRAPRDDAGARSLPETRRNGFSVS
jgi:hypothetical protein